MKIEQVISFLAQVYPPAQAMDWDNPGLQVGRADRPVRKIMVALDATLDVIHQCADWGADLLVTHHPLLLSGVRQINDAGLAGKRILALAEQGIAHYAMHTNYDVTMMGDLAAQALDLSQISVLEPTGTARDGKVIGVGRVGNLPGTMTAQECCARVKSAFGLSSVRLFGKKEAEVCRIAVSPGSGKSMIAPALLSGAGLLVTGDIGHHDGIDAVDSGLLIIDAGHYGVEHIFVAQMQALLRKQFPELEVRAADQAAPFEVY